MTVQDREDGTGDGTNRPDGDPPGGGAGAGEARNSVAATVSGVVVQAHTITGGVHHHSAVWGRPVPRQLPAAPAAFVGRVGDLAALTAVVDAGGAGGTVVISALAGAGGIGKTWLALRWAHAHRDRFPGGQLFVDLRGFSPVGEPMPPEVAVRGFLDGLGVDPGRLPVDLHAQAALYRSLITGKRMLVVLDNAATVEQLAPLLPGDSSCTVLVTSRRRLPGLVTSYGAHPLQLDVLPRGEARQLLAARLGADRVEAEAEAVDGLLAVCGGFPLALAIVAGHARTRPRLPLAALAAELRDTATRLDVLDSDDPAASLPTVLSWSHRTLTVEQRQVFALLGIAPGPDIGLPAAASLTGLSVTRVKRVLGVLEEASLLDHDGHSRYRMHDLIRTYATTTANDLGDEARTAALRRVLDFYTHTAHTADHLLEPHRTPIRPDPPSPGTHAHSLSDDPAAMAWFDSEHPNLLAAQHTATTHAWHHIVGQLAWTLGTFHHRRGHHHDRLAVWQGAVDAAAHLPDPTTRTLAHRLVGYAYAALGCHEEATGHLNRALALAEHHHDTTHQAHTHHMLAMACELQGDDRRALDHARRALNLYRALDQPVWEATALNAVGWYAARLGDHDTARAHCQAALTLHRHHHNPTGKAATLDSLGYIDHHTGHHDHAIHHYRQALTLRRDLGDTYEAAGTLDWLGHPHAALGQIEHAHTVWQEALQLYRDQGRDADAHRVQQQLDALDHPGPEQPPQTT